MIKSFYVIAVMLFVLSLCSCGSEATSSAEDIFDEPAPKVVTVTTAATLQDSSSQTEIIKKWVLFDESFPAYSRDNIKTKNYYVNSQVKIDGFIKCGQNTDPVNRLRLGKYSFGYNGCEVIATYNFLEYLGAEPNIAKLSFDFEVNGLISEDGAFGSSPQKIEGYFDAVGIDAKKVFSAEECDKALSEGKAVMMSFFTGSSAFSEIHTVFVCNDNGIYYVYNRYNEAEGQTQIESCSELMQKDSLFIIGYTE